MASIAPAPGHDTQLRFVAPAPAARAKLRVGVFADRALQPRWIVEALAKVAACEHAEIALVVTAADAQPAPRAPLAWRAYRALDRRVFGDATDWSAPCDLQRLVPSARRMTIDAQAPSDWQAAVGDRALDVAFAVGSVDDAMLDGLARFGVWRYCFGEGHATDESLAGVREVIDAAPVIATGIRIRRADGAGRVASASWARTLAFSLARSRDGALAKSAEFVTRCLRDLHAGGEDWLETATRPAVNATPARLPAPGIAEAARLAGRVARRAAECALTVGQWQLALRFGSTARWNGSLEGFTRLVPPRDRFWADPFPLEVNGRHYIFFEELPFAAGKAHISVMEVDEAGCVSAPRRVLERDYHLSYPFLVEDAGTLYMIPETAENRTVEIYRCVEFPHRWKFERALLRGLWAADATLHRSADRWWMFVNIGRDGCEINDELSLFSAEALLGDWRAHRRNPVKSDVRAARPAGRLFTRGDTLYRPSQHCTPLYGSGLVVNRVLRLDDHDYAEEEERRILPAPGEGILGLHTLNRAGALTVTDAFVRRPRWR